ncbi:MAG TPA: AAA family ATPase [Methylomirabilota bacterium]|nr:AAA family ATPase [Methylomirabilota bacterium]
MRCPACHRENPLQAKFCLECGIQLAISCARCDAVLPADAKFCSECGHSTNSPIPDGARPVSPAYSSGQVAQKAPTFKATLEGERKQVTVLFADVKGSMELLADRDPEDARRLLDPVLEHMMEAVRRYGGTVNQVMGDGIMALFGAPLADEDHAIRACYAALRIHETLRWYGDQEWSPSGVPVSIRVGLNSGEVVVRSIGSDIHMDYTAIGQTTHLAHRMEQAAPPGSTYLTANTLRLVEGRVEAQSLGPMPIKGLLEPVEVYELTGATLLRRRFDTTALRGLTRFVGRDAELRRLGRALTQAGKNHGQVVAIVGDPGVGKSRLLYEFLHSHRTHGWLVLESESVSYGKTTPFLSVIELLKRYFRLEPRSDPATIQEQVSSTLLALDPGLEPTLPALLALLDVPVENPAWRALDPPQRRQFVLDAVTRVLVRESHVRPLILVLEDLHWIDSDSEAVLDSLIEVVPSARLLILVSYRPEYQHKWDSRAYYRQMKLEPLHPSSADTFLRHLLGTEPALQPLKRILIERTGGNPLFLEECVRTLVESHILAGDRGALRLMKPLPNIQVPATVQAVLAARIDRLPTDEKHLLQSAAVIGQDVPFDLLRAVTDLSDDQLRNSLAHLQAVDLMYEGESSEELVYSFKHALTHDVAYQSLLQERRRTLHARIVEEIERLHRDHLGDQVELLAYHATSGETWEKAVAYWRQAGLRALSHSSHDRALDCFERALTALQRLPRSRANVELAIDLRLDIRTSILPLGRFTELLEHLEEARGSAESLADQLRLGRVCAYLTDYFRQIGDHARGLDFGERGLELAKLTGNLALEVSTRIYLAHVSYDMGRFLAAIRLLHQVVESVKELPEDERFGLPYIVSVHSRTWLALCLAEVGRFSEALDVANEAMRIAGDSDHPSSLTSAHVAVGRVHVRRGQILTSVPILERGLELCRRWNIRLLFPFLAESLGLAYSYSGRVDAGLPLLHEAQAVHMAMRGTAGQAIRLVSLSQGYLAAGELDEAEHLAARGWDMAQQHKEMGNAAYALVQRGEVSLARSDREQATLHYRHALTIAEELDMRPLAARCRLGLGVAQTQRADVAAALDVLNTLGMPLWSEQAARALLTLT